MGRKQKGFLKAAFKKLNTDTSSNGSYHNEKGLSEMHQPIQSQLVVDVDKVVLKRPVLSLVKLYLSNRKWLII